MSDVLSRVVNVAEQVADAALGIVGVRVLTEEPKHTTRRLTDSVEIRRYGPRIAAETTVQGVDEEQARSDGFRRLAGYIFGGNQAGEKVAMTAPVSQGATSGQKIAMTAPVSTSSDADGWVIRFFMPSKWTMGTLPTPKDDRVHLVEVPEESVAAIRFTGSRSPDAVTSKTRELLDALSANGIETTGDPVSWFYDPPWTLPFRRRNEVVVPVR
ncbi:SOUL family heme-binding protein [Williamsia deligens]|uniref:SOUL family heme-binding protein n=1 Tax=Williamsia deligens TaxID=321325 RepID=A0ABW3GCH9_9NOCA|nr:heme-binding protein [Williamsia deligens]MCP2192736.1 SOUL heme-binding protein [Williamsia deligens]